MLKGKELVRMSKRLIKLNVNGEEYEVNIRPHWTLAYVLRNQLDLTGTKVSCGRGECGSCTVLVDGKAVSSCLMLAAQAEGKRITTIEGLSKAGELHPIQDAFIKLGAVQCGYCTPGLILSAASLLRENPTPTEDEVRDYLQNNICRCTGYVKPVAAILAASRIMEEEKHG